MIAPKTGSSSNSTEIDSVINPLHFRRTLWLTFLLPVVSITTLVFILSLLTSHLFSQADWTNHTDQVVNQAYLCPPLIVDMETGLRGFEATKDGSFGSRQCGRPRAPKEFELSVLVGDNESQTKRVRELQSKFAGWKSFATNMLSITTSGNLPQATPENMRGKALMDSIRSAFSDFVESERKLRRLRSDDVERLKKEFLIARIGLGIPIAVALGWFLRKKVFQMAREYNLIIGAVQAQRELLQVTLSSVGDAVITTDVEGKVTALESGRGVNDGLDYQ